MLKMFVWIDSLHPSLQFFSHVGTDLLGFNQAVDKMAYSRTQHRASREATMLKKVDHEFTG